MQHVVDMMLLTVPELCYHGNGPAPQRPFPYLLLPISSVDPKPTSSILHNLFIHLLLLEQSLSIPRPDHIYLDTSCNADRQNGRLVR